MSIDSNAIHYFTVCDFIISGKDSDYCCWLCVNQGKWENLGLFVECLSAVLAPALEPFILSILQITYNVNTFKYI